MSNRNLRRDILESDELNNAIAASIEAERIRLEQISSEEDELAKAIAASIPANAGAGTGSGAPIIPAGSTVKQTKITKIQIRDDGWCIYRTFLTGINLSCNNSTDLDNFKKSKGNIVLLQNISNEEIRNFTRDNAMTQINNIHNPLLITLNKLKDNYCHYLNLIYTKWCKDMNNKEDVRCIKFHIFDDFFIRQGQQINQNRMTKDEFILFYITELQKNAPDGLSPLVYPDIDMFLPYIGKICYITDFNESNPEQLYECKSNDLFSILQKGVAHIDLGLFVKSSVTGGNTYRNKYFKYNKKYLNLSNL